MQQTPFITRIYRLFRIIIHTIAGLFLAAVVLPFVNSKVKSSLIKRWCAGLLKAFNIHLKLFGQLPLTTSQGFMLVANHVSWIDIHALNSLIALRFISKDDVKSWPIFGYLAIKVNTLFIDRAKLHEASKIVDICAESLIKNDNLCFFPEGTTSDGRQVLPFKSSLLQAAINANACIYPIAIRYLNEDGSINTQMAYAGETTMLQSVVSIINIKSPKVELHFLAPINSAGQNRRQLTQFAFDVIVAKLAKTNLT